MEKKRILFVAMQMSSHTARWINQLSDHDFEIHLFPVNYLPIHPELRNVTVHQPWQVVNPLGFFRRKLSGQGNATYANESADTVNPKSSVVLKPIYPIPILPFMRRYLNGAVRISLGESGATAPATYGPRVLAKLIRMLKPDLIHSLEFQHCGYNVLRAKELIGKPFPRWLATNWGSDIYYYRQFEKHRSQISRLLQNADYYSCECKRDIKLARDLGFTGRVMPVMPNSGGIDIAHAENLRKKQAPSKRKIIMVKGYQHFAGRALMALEAIALCVDELRGFKIVIYSASAEIHEAVNVLRSKTGLDVEIMEQVNHEHMLHMFSRARIYLGVSVSDAISTSLLEAMAMGAFPIQTNTSCCNEWIEDGVSGYEIPADDVQVIVSRLQNAIVNDGLVDNASNINWKTVRDRLDQTILKQRAIGFYETIFSEVPHGAQ